ncbi:MAG: single-stranded DNA-binding protein [Bacilli bacterium]|nr:single-stranded DNA-binding protein [Bacilli bacterium]
MLNQVVMVGRLVADPEVKETENGKKVSNITLAVQRSYKNAEGVYETDFIDCTLFDGVAHNTAEYCHKGDIVGVKGRIQTDIYEKDGENKKSTSLIAEKITFLSSNKNLTKENDDDLDM